MQFKPGGSLFITTINKTIPMWVGGVLLGEYVLNIAPVGTHHWNKMISPLDVQRILDTSKKKQFFLTLKQATTVNPK